MEDPRVVAWREAWKEDDAGYNPKIIWFTSKTYSTTISHVTLEVMDSVSGFDKEINSHTPKLLHSLYHIDKPSTNLPENKRTACTLLKEAIFQLLLQVPSLLQENEKPQAICNTRDHSTTEKDMGMEELAQLLQELLNTYESSSSSEQSSSDTTSGSSSAPHTPQQNSSQKPPIFWIIDRIDTCIFKARPKHIEPALRPLYWNASELRKFADVLQKLVSRLAQGKSHEDSRGERSGGLRVLVTSIYGPTRIDEGFLEHEDGDDGHSGYEKGRKKRSDIWEELSV